MQRLHASGRQAAGEWLDANANQVGLRSSIAWEAVHYPGQDAPR